MIDLSRQIHITALAPYKIFPAKMGGQKGIALFYAYLSRLTSLTLVSTKNNAIAENLQATFLPVLPDSRLRYINPMVYFTIKKILKENNSSQLIIEHPYYGWLGICCKRFCKIKLLVHSHNIEALRFKSTGKWWWRILWNYERFVHRQADTSFFVTDEDLQYAIAKFALDPAKCHVSTYGIEESDPPADQEKELARKKVKALHHIDEDEKILFFNGTLSYKPNLDAVDIILKHINPELKAKKDFRYRILIAGKGLPQNYIDLLQQTENISYTGFVDDISIYFKAADIFINPVLDGGGIKTKLVEALANNVNSVSTVSGSFGIPESITGEKLSIVPDGDWATFVNKIRHANLTAVIPGSFYEHFYWGNIVKKTAAILNG